jgi:histidinol-phosphate aminotransferase
MGGDSVAHLVPEFSNLLVTWTFSKTESLAGLRIGYAILPEVLAKDLNNHNDAYPLTRPSQAAALATLHNEEEIHRRVTMLRVWTRKLAEELGALGVRTFPTDAYFFLADFATTRRRDRLLGAGYMRVITSLPEDNARFLAVLRELL